MSIYKPFHNPDTEIRLLTIFPSCREDDDVQLGLEIFPLSGTPPYEALSYTWNINSIWDWEYTVLFGTIEVNVLENLYHALKALRRPKDPRVIWNDRLCINQKDDGEKQHQLSLMRDVYARAEKVIAWLGRRGSIALEHYAKTTSQTVQGTISPRIEQSRFSFYDIIRASLDAIVNRELWPVAHHVQAREPSTNNVVDRPWTDAWSYRQHIGALEELMADPYWQRIWVVQELAAADKIEVHMDSNVFEWSFLLEAAKIIDHHFQSCCQNRKGLTDDMTAAIDKYLALFSRVILDIDAMRRLYRSKTRLEPLLRRHRNKLATEHVDIMNALINLVGDWGSAPPLRVSPRGTDFADLVCATIISQTNAFSSLSLLCGDVGKGEDDLDEATCSVLDHAAINKALEVSEEQMRAQGIFGDNLPHLLHLRELELIKAEQRVAAKNLYARNHLPSWASCFASCGMLDNIGPMYTSPRFDCLSLYKATEDSLPIIEMQVDRTLHIRGLLIDTINFVADETLADRPGAVLVNLNGKLFDDSKDAVLKDWKDQVDLSWPRSKVYPSQRALRLAFTRTLHCDIAIREGHSSVQTGRQARRLTTEEVEDYYLRIFGPYHVDGSADTQSGEAHRGPISYNACALGRKLFITDAGRIGLGSPVVEEGDQIVLFYGGTVPFVLRKCSAEHGTSLGEEGQHQLLGDCYCDGIMDGEASCVPNIQQQTFRLV